MCAHVTDLPTYVTPQHDNVLHKEEKLLCTIAYDLFCIFPLFRHIGNLLGTFNKSADPLGLSEGAQA